MTPQQLLSAVSGAMLKNPPQGLTRKDVRGFLTRNEAALLAAIQRSFEKLCRPDAFIAGYEQRIGYSIAPVEDAGPLLFAARDAGQSSTVFLAVKARCHAKDPVRLREYAVCTKRNDEQTWRIASGMTWVGSEIAAIQDFVSANAHNARWMLEDDKEWRGVKSGSLVLAYQPAWEIAAESLIKARAGELERRIGSVLAARGFQGSWHRDESPNFRWLEGIAFTHSDGVELVTFPYDPEEMDSDPEQVQVQVRLRKPDKVRSLTIRHNEVEVLEKWLTEAGYPVTSLLGTRPVRLATQKAPESTVASLPVREEAPPVASIPTVPATAQSGPPLPEPPPSGAKPTLWGGLSGAAIPNESVRQGMRIVTANGEHGVVEKVDVAVWSVRGVTSWGEATSDTRQEKSYSFVVRLDSGRSGEFAYQLFEELAAPQEVPPDPVIHDSHQPVSPSEAWRQVLAAHRAIDYNLEKASNARKPSNKAEYQNESRKAKVTFDKNFQRFFDWRERYPRAPIENFDHLIYRLLALESLIPSTERMAERRWLQAVPKDWRTRFTAGEFVIRATFAEGNEAPLQARDRIVSIANDEATMVSDGVRVPLYLLRSAPDEVLEPPKYTEGRWLVEVAEDMLAPKTDQWGKATKAWLERGAAARAIKSYLSYHGIDVRTHVQSGANMNGVELRPPGDRWSTDDVTRMNQLLPGLGADTRDATFHPTAKQGEPGDPMADYYGRPSGIWLEPDQIADFAPYLARGMKDAGQTINQVGEAWLAKSSKGGTGSATPASGGRNGATPDQRQVAADGCIDISFQMAGHGMVRVVCGAKGRRDVWHNIYCGQSRFGFNGGRWAKGLVPPKEVLEEVRRRGITAFGADERLEEPSPDIQLDPVVWELVQNGGLRADLIVEIAEELRPKARAIPGFLRRDGKDWLELARLHYEPEGAVVVEELPPNHWDTGLSYETPSSYAELLNFALDFSYPDVRDEHYEDEELVERLCSCQRSVGGRR